MGVRYTACMGKQQLHELIDRLPESETGAAARYLEFLLAHDEAPIDPEMLQQIKASRRDAGGAWIAHADVLREFGGAGGVVRKIAANIAEPELRSTFLEGQDIRQLFSESA